MTKYYISLLNAASIPLIRCTALSHCTPTRRRYLARESHRAGEHLIRLSFRNRNLDVCKDSIFTIPLASVVHFLRATSCIHSWGQRFRPKSQATQKAGTWIEAEMIWSPVWLHILLCYRLKFMKEDDHFTEGWWSVLNSPSATVNTDDGRPAADLCVLYVLLRSHILWLHHGPAQRHLVGVWRAIKTNFKVKTSYLSFKTIWFHTWMNAEWASEGR